MLRFLPDTKSADGARTVTTEGLNPAVMSAEEVEEKIAKALNHCLQSLSISAADVENVFSMVPDAYQEEQVW